MARSDDLAPLFAEDSGDGVGYRQGVIVEWNSTNAANKVRVGATVLEDLNIFNSTEASQLAPGDVVGILTVGPSWFILGRVTVPKTPAAASALAAVFSRIVVARDDGVGSRDSDVFGDLTGAAVGPAVTVNISSSGRALVLWSADSDMGAVWRSVVTSGVSIAVSGATSMPADGEWSLGPYLEAQQPAQIAGGFQGAMMHLFTGLNPGINTFTMKYRHVGKRFGESAITFQAREIAVFAM